MSVGSKIREIRKLYGITQVELAEACGIDDSTVRKYESGRLNPKPATIEKIAKGLGVPAEILTSVNVDSETAMKRLFSIFQDFGGNLKQGKEIDDDDIYISFKKLQPFMRSWYGVYVRYLEDIKKADSIIDEDKRDSWLKGTEGQFKDWMFTYPSKEPRLDMLHTYNTMDKAMAYMHEHPLNDSDNPVTPEEKEKIIAEGKMIFGNDKK